MRRTARMVFAILATAAVLWGGSSAASADSSWKAADSVGGLVGPDEYDWLSVPYGATSCSVDHMVVVEQGRTLTRPHACTSRYSLLRFVVSPASFARVTIHDGNVRVEGIKAGTDYVSITAIDPAGGQAVFKLTIVVVAP